MAVLLSSVLFLDIGVGVMRFYLARAKGHTVFYAAVGVLGAHLGFCLACLLTVTLRLAFLYRLLGVRLRWRYILTLPAVAFAVIAFYSFSPLVNLAVLAFALFLSFLLLFPEIRLVSTQISRKHI